MEQTIEVLCPHCQNEFEATKSLETTCPRCKKRFNTLEAARVSSWGPYWVSIRVGETFVRFVNCITCGQLVATDEKRCPRCKSRLGDML